MILFFVGIGFQREFSFCFVIIVEYFKELLGVKGFFLYLDFFRVFGIKIQNNLEFDYLVRDGFLSNSLFYSSEEEGIDFEGDMLDCSGFWFFFMEFEEEDESCRFFQGKLGGVVLFVLLEVFIE